MNISIYFLLLSAYFPALYSINNLYIGSKPQQLLSITRSLLNDDIFPSRTNLQSPIEPGMYGFGSRKLEEGFDSSIPKRDYRTGPWTGR